jgi:hypothetical protein
LPYAIAHKAFSLYQSKKRIEKNDNMRTKKLFIWSLVCLTALGCAGEQDLVVTPAGKGKEIKFSATDSRRSDLRSTATDESRLSNFRVFGALLPDGTTDTYQDTAFMPGIIVSYYNSQWRYDPVKRLPAAPAQVSYWAYSPGVSLNASNFQAGGGVAPTLDYTVPADITHHEDLLIAKTDALATAEVPLTFSHPLAQVVFSAKGNNVSNPYVVEDVGLINWKGKGTYNYTDNSWTIAADAPKVSYENLLTSPHLVNGGKVGTEYTPLTSGAQNTALFILPGATSAPTEPGVVSKEDTVLGKSYIAVTYSAKKPNGTELNP